MTKLKSRTLLREVESLTSEMAKKLIGPFGYGNKVVVTVMDIKKKSLKELLLCILVHHMGILEIIK